MQASLRSQPFGSTRPRHQAARRPLVAAAVVTAPPAARRANAAAAAPRRAEAAAAAPAQAAQAGAASAAAAALAAFALALSPLAAPPPAAAKPNAALDVPACSDFKASPASGVRFCEVKEGSGPPPEAGDLVVVDYTARALAAGGRVFDGSQGFKFFVGEKDLTIPGGGFDLALLGDGGAMPPIKEGGARTVVLPPALAFGPGGDGCLYGLDKSCRVPPGSEVELTFRYRGLGY